MTVLRIILQILLVLTSALLVLSVLLQKGKGGGLSDMFGSGLSSTASASGVANRNLTLITVIVASTWFAAVVLLGLLVRFV